MFGKFLRESKIVAAIMVFLRMYLGWIWLTSGWGKVIGGFSAGGFLQGAVANPVMKGDEVVYPLYTAFLQHVAIPYEGAFSHLVAWGEILVGLGLLLGVFTSVAAFFGIVMNLSFLFAGTISTNPWMIMISMFIIAAGVNAGRYGGDRWVLPYLKGLVKKDPQSESFENREIKEVC